MPVEGVRLVQRGLAWQELPGVALSRNDSDQVSAVLDGGAKRFVVKLEEGKVFWI